MDDLISRQAAIDSVRAGVLSTATLYGRTEEGETARKEIERTIKALPSVSTEKTRWIPVSEKLPEDGIYLVTVERTPGVPRIETKSFAKDLHRVDDYDFPEHKCGWYEYDSEYGYWEDTKVIAWMPLPQPYKAESEVLNETCD